MRLVWIILIAVLVCVIPVAVLFLRRMRTGEPVTLAASNPLAYAPNTVLPYYAEASNASVQPGESWCRPFCESSFQSAYKKDDQLFAKCVTRTGNGWFDVRKIGGQLKRSKVVALIK